MDYFQAPIGRGFLAAKKSVYQVITMGPIFVYQVNEQPPPPGPTLMVIEWVRQLGGRQNGVLWFVPLSPVSSPTGSEGWPPSVEIIID